MYAYFITKIFSLHLITTIKQNDHRKKKIGPFLHPHLIRHFLLDYYYSLNGTVFAAAAVLVCFQSPPQFLRRYLHPLLLLLVHCYPLDLHHPQ